MEKKNVDSWENARLHAQIIPYYGIALRRIVLDGMSLRHSTFYELHASPSLKRFRVIRQTSKALSCTTMMPCLSKMEGLSTPACQPQV